MGNCLFKPKSNYCERLETEIFYLQKENLRSYDLFLRELKSLKSSVQKLELPISSTLNEPQKITYVWTVLRVLITILTDYLFILSSDLSVYPIIIPTYYVIFHQSVNSIIIFTDYLFILSSDLPINKNTKKNLATIFIVQSDNSKIVVDKCNLIHHKSGFYRTIHRKLLESVFELVDGH